MTFYHQALLYNYGLNFRKTLYNMFSRLKIRVRARVRVSVTVRVRVRVRVTTDLGH